MPPTRREIAARALFALLALGVIVLLASLSGGPTSAASCARGFVPVNGHCHLQPPAAR